MDNRIEQEMREWLKECFSEEYDQEQIDGLSYRQLEKCINKYYAGGMVEFLLCCGLAVNS